MPAELYEAEMKLAMLRQFPGYRLEHLEDDGVELMRLLQIEGYGKESHG